MMEEKREVLQNAQVAVLGSMLIDEACVGPVLQEVKPEYFTVSQYRRIFEAIRTLAAGSKAVDPVTVLNAVGEEYRSLLAQLMDLTPTAKNVMAYCGILRKEARLQLLHQAAERMLAAETEEDLHAALDRINAAMVARPGVKRMDMTEAMLDFFARHGDDAPEPDYLPMLFPKLQELRIAPGDLVYLGGYPSDGKTTLALMLACAQAKKKRVGFFSLETSCEKLTDSLACAVAQVDLANVQLNRLSEEEWSRLGRRGSQLSERSLELIEAAGMSAADIRLYAQARHYDVIYIDYIQLIPGQNRGNWHQSDFERVSGNSLALKQLGRETGITVIALSQMTRPERTKDGKIPPPSMSNLRSSGQLEQDADAVLLLFRENASRSDSDRIITVGKVKTGPAGLSFYLEFDGPKQTFRDSKRNYLDSAEQFPLLPLSTPVPWEEDESA